ncbi:MAG: fibrobacter succinogenes major paralogous domain-containing protein [Candidatus Kapabacteria bacterium]|nr:fibrobacter succinogenes major paralogous domain-containing protein [Candidatus Kapabacteria bacterium]
MKVYLADGSSKQYKLADIDSLTFSNKTEKSQMQIFYSQTNTAYYPPYLIDKIVIENSYFLTIYISGYPKYYILKEIDSIIFYPTEYPAITIGNLVWMSRNLDVDHYRNGDSIPEARDSATWSNDTNGIWCYYNNSDSLGKIYGKLYNWFTVDDKRGLAPKGWHIPRHEEFLALRDYLGGGLNIGGGLKESGKIHWKSPNRGATNETGFSAFPSGQRWGGQPTEGLGIICRYLVSTECETKWAWNWCLSSTDIMFFGDGFSKKVGCAIRCIKDK